jgi:hypothetical protein
MAGSGMELVQSLLAQQESNRGATQASQQSALDAYNRRLQALRDSSSLGRSIRADDINLEGQNVDIINDYKQRAAARRQEQNRYAAGTRNAADESNLTREQMAANSNVGARNAARIRAQDQANDHAITRYNAQNNKTQALIGASNAAIQAAQQNAADMNQAVSGISSGITGGIGAYQQGQAADKSAMMTDRQNMAKYGSKYKSIYDEE